MPAPLGNDGSYMCFDYSGSSPNTQQEVGNVKAGTEYGGTLADVCAAIGPEEDLRRLQYRLPNSGSYQNSFDRASPTNLLDSAPTDTPTKAVPDEYHDHPQKRRRPDPESATNTCSFSGSVPHAPEEHCDRPQKPRRLAFESGALANTGFMTDTEATPQLLDSSSHQSSISDRASPTNVLDSAPTDTPTKAVPDGYHDHPQKRRRPDPESATSTCSLSGPAPHVTCIQAFEEELRGLIRKNIGASAVELVCTVKDPSWGGCRTEHKIHMKFQC